MWRRHSTDGKSAGTNLIFGMLPLLPMLQSSRPRPSPPPKLLLIVNLCPHTLDSIEQTQCRVLITSRAYRSISRGNWVTRSHREWKEPIGVTSRDFKPSSNCKDCWHIWTHRYSKGIAIDQYKVYYGGRKGKDHHLALFHRPVQRRTAAVTYVGFMK